MWNVMLAALIIIINKKILATNSLLFESVKNVHFPDLKQIFFDKKNLLFDKDSINLNNKSECKLNFSSTLIWG